MTDHKRTDSKKTPSFAEDVKLLAERLKERQHASAQKRDLAFNEHFTFMERHIYDALGIPKHVNKSLLFGLTYGAHSVISMGTPVRRRTFTGTGMGLSGTISGRFSSSNNPGYTITSTTGAMQDYNGIMCQPVLSIAIIAVAGYSPACPTCPYSTQCLRCIHPNVCSRYRATVPQHGFPLILGGGGDVEKEFCRIQPPKERVSCACPLFQGSLMTCAYCKESRPYVTRVRVLKLEQPEGYSRFEKKVHIRRKPKPPENTFYTFLRSRYGRDIYEKQTQRRSASRFANRTQNKR